MKISIVTHSLDLNYSGGSIHVNNVDKSEVLSKYIKSIAQRFNLKNYILSFYDATYNNYINVLKNKVFNQNVVFEVGCKGCEYDIRNVHSDYDRVHYDYKDIEKRLKGVNFKVRHNLPRHIKEI